MVEKKTAQQRSVKKETKLSIAKVAGHAMNFEFSCADDAKDEEEEHEEEFARLRGRRNAPDSRSRGIRNTRHSSDST